MIKIKISDTIVDIIDKIDLQHQWDIILDFPLWHPILHNYISLKILKSKVWNKKLIIATSDKIWKKIWKRLWIEYSVVKDNDFLQDQSNSWLMGHNFTFWEYFRFQVSSYKKEFINALETNKKLNTLWKYSRIYQEKTSVHIFLWALAISFIIFMFIYYFAISKSYIYILPQINVKKEAHNFIFNENDENTILWNNKNIKISTISKTIHSSETFAATEILENNNISKWDIRIYNELLAQQTLVPNTRFATEEGLLFETLEWVSIPAGIQDNFWAITPWFIDVSIQAKTKDIQSIFIGSRGNIKEGIDLSIPGLDNETQKLIYAKTISDFSGWTDSFEKVISQKDIDLSQDIFTQKIKTQVIQSIKDKISLENSKNNTQIDILSWWKSITYSEPIITLEAWIEPWVKKESFTINGSITANVYTYNKESIIQKLKTLLWEKTLEWVEKISHIDESSVRMSQVIYSNTDPFEMKATFEIEALFLYDFLHKDNTYVSQLKSEIRWLNKQEAEKILLNNPNISNVEIELRPFFTKNISNIYNNIIFKIQ